MKKPLNEQIKDQRISAGLTQDVLAKQLGFKTHQAYNQIERGRRRITAELLQKLVELHNFKFEL